MYDVITMTQKLVTFSPRSFRPHRIRLLREIRRWKRAQTLKCGVDESTRKTDEVRICVSNSPTTAPKLNTANEAVLAGRHKEDGGELDYKPLALAQRTAAQLSPRFNAESNKQDLQQETTQVRPDVMQSWDNMEPSLQGTAPVAEDTTRSHGSSARSRESWEHASIVHVDSSRHSSSTATPVWDRSADVVPCTRASIPSGEQESLLRQTETARATNRRLGSSTRWDSVNSFGSRHYGEVDVGKPSVLRDESDDQGLAVVACPKLPGREDDPREENNGDERRDRPLEARDFMAEHKSKVEHAEQVSAPSALPTTTTGVATNFTSNHMTSGLKGTLHLSGVHAANIRISFGAKNPSLRIRTCNQLLHVQPVKGK